MIWLSCMKIRQAIYSALHKCGHWNVWVLLKGTEPQYSMQLSQHKLHFFSMSSAVAQSAAALALIEPAG